jgi:hypothetical protein
MMQINFVGSMDEIMADIVRVLNGMGFKVVPFNEEPVDRAQTDTIKKRGRPPKVAPEPVVIDDDDADAEAMKQAGFKAQQAEDEDMEIPSTGNSGSHDAIALHKLKQETLARLRDLFMAGKGAKIRELLKKHGHGALVFPEIEAKYFPAIKADIDKELGQ